MALEAQGLLIRRAATIYATCADSTVITVTTGTTNGVVSSDAPTKNLDTLGFTVGMRVQITNTSGVDNNTGIFTIGTAAGSGTVIEFFEKVSIVGSGEDLTSSISLVGSSMETIGEIYSFSGPSGAAAVINVSNFQSVAHEKLVGIKDEGQLTFEFTYSTVVADLHQKLNADRIARKKRKFDIVLPDADSGNAIDGSFMFFEGYITAFSLSGAIDDAIKGSITLDITDELHWTPTSR